MSDSLCLFTSFLSFPQTTSPFFFPFRNSFASSTITYLCQLGSWESLPHSSHSINHQALLNIFGTHPYFPSQGLTIFHLRSDQISRSVMSDSLRPHESQHARPSSHLILCHSLLLLPPIPPSIRVNSLHEVAKLLKFQL